MKPYNITNRAEFDKWSKSLNECAAKDRAIALDLFKLDGSRTPLDYKTSAMHRTINRRAETRREIDMATENGMVAYCERGRDCDGVAYDGVYIDAAPKGVLEYWKRLEDSYEWRDGPHSEWLDKPSRYPEGDYRNTRDLGMEAFENGHPHVIYA